jgi:hypothetical protein
VVEWDSQTGNETSTLSVHLLDTCPCWTSPGSDRVAEIGHLAVDFVGSKHWPSPATSPVPKHSSVLLLSCADSANGFGWSSMAGRGLAYFLVGTGKWFVVLRRQLRH